MNYDCYECLRVCAYNNDGICECDKYPLDHGACPVCMEEEE